MIILIIILMIILFSSKTTENMSQNNLALKNIKEINLNNIKNKYDYINGEIDKIIESSKNLIPNKDPVIEKPITINENGMYMIKHIKFNNLDSTIKVKSGSRENEYFDVDLNKYK